MQSPLSMAVVDSGQPRGYVVNKHYMDEVAKVYHENMALRAEMKSLRKSQATSS